MCEQVTKELDTKKCWTQAEMLLSGCPFCEGIRFLEGPHGGLCINVKCANCGATFNDRGPFGWELLSGPKITIEETMPSDCPESAMVEGRTADISLAEFERRVQLCITEEQVKIDSNNYLMSVLCDAVRIAREYSDAMQVKDLMQP